MFSGRQFNVHLNTHVGASGFGAAGTYPLYSALPHVVFCVVSNVIITIVPVSNKQKQTIKMMTVARSRDIAFFIKPKVDPVRHWPPVLVSVRWKDIDTPRIICCPIFDMPNSNKCAQSSPPTFELVS